MTNPKEVGESMQFVRTDTGLINLAFVERIERGSEGKAVFRLQNSSGVSDISFDELESSLGVVVPNTSGAQALFLEVVESEVTHFVSPIIAWRIYNQDATPILISGDECSFVLLPGGQVDELYSGTFDTLEDAKAAFLQRTNK